jgi:hypothetical protein
MILTYKYRIKDRSTRKALVTHSRSVSSVLLRKAGGLHNA